jgi:hypothetical protein
VTSFKGPEPTGRNVRRCPRICEVTGIYLFAGM